MAVISSKPSVYDTLPVLDAWYKPIPKPTPSSSAAHRQHNRSTHHNTVSFSNDPPSVHYVNYNQHSRWNRPADSVKLFVKNINRRIRS
ncbi:hypothetical protein O0I10_008124 [Lichtheimia ornata]|uniref:Uncharacterized protein n=1 Tax=Lichtheimia ornata TaxID=688661 RepID=A0AAD7V1U1_9FUNG|nr:uncharacterized protein O0I10_008124 [Lichtheimia ornata]KAJ8656111.1 hypothetical protein O0I10_008124 [Lichtheimia ornata]